MSRRNSLRVFGATWCQWQWERASCKLVNCHEWSRASCDPWNEIIYLWASCQIRKLLVAHAPGMPETFSPPQRVSEPDMHHGTCMARVPWSMSGSLISGFLWSRWRRKRSRHSRCITDMDYRWSGEKPLLETCKFIVSGTPRNTFQNNSINDKQSPEKDLSQLTQWPLGNLNDSWLRHLLWNCPNMNVIGLHWWSVNIGSGNGLVPSGNKPLPEPMLTDISVAIWCH